MDAFLRLSNWSFINCQGVMMSLDNWGCTSEVKKILFIRALIYWRETCERLMHETVGWLLIMAEQRNPCTELPGQREAEVKNWGVDVDSGAISDAVTLVGLNGLLRHCLKSITVDRGADVGSLLVGLLMFQRLVSLVTLKKACVWPYRPFVFAWLY